VARNRIDWTKQPLGRVPDKLLATQLGVTRQTVWAARRRLAAKQSTFAGAIEVVDATDICQDDRCSRIEIHAKHHIDRSALDPFVDNAYGYRKVARHGQTLRAIVAKHIERRRCKVFREIYDDVIYDYGSFVSKDAGARAIWRAISDLLSQDVIVNVKVSGCRSPGGYIRSDSPLLKDTDGQRFLLETLEDAFPTAA
jgi:hypothetical protein